MERVYSVNPHGKIKEAMLKFAKEKAKKMNIKLYSSERSIEGKGEKKEFVRLINRGSRSQYVYTDSGGGLAAEGEFKILATAA
jgi:hypothetical protein